MRDVLLVEVIPIIVALVAWGFMLRLARRVDVERRPSRASAADPAPAFDVAVVTASPPVGHKAAQIVAGADRAWFAGISHQVYGVDDAATCRLNDCEPPSADCSCGFYAFADVGDAVDVGARLSRHPVRSHALLQVELSGNVLAFERGFRGARQRVLRVDVDRACHRCARKGVERVAVGLGADRRDRRRQLFCDVRPRAFSSLPVGSAPVRPLCGPHLARASRRLTPGDLAGLLGTEVGWRADG